MKDLKNQLEAMCDSADAKRIDCINKSTELKREIVKLETSLTEMKFKLKDVEFTYAEMKSMCETLETLYDDMFESEESDREDDILMEGCNER